LSLPLIEDMKGPRKQALLSVLIVLAVAADQLTGVIALVLVGARALTALTRNQRDEIAGKVKVALPGIVLFLATAYAELIVPGIGLVSQQAPLPTLTSASLSLGFLGYAYLTLVPLILIGLRKVSSIELRTWSVFCIATVVTAILPFFGPIVQSYRWSLLLDIPLCIFAAAGLHRIVESVDPRIGWARNFHRLILPTFSTALMVSGILYITLRAYH